MENNRPTQQFDWARDCVDLEQRPAYKEKLETVRCIIEASCPIGAEIAASFSRRVPKCLVFKDAIMDAYQSPDTNAFHGVLDGVAYIGMRESILRDDDKQYGLLKYFIHEGTHHVQSERFPITYNDVRDPALSVRNKLAFETNAFTDTAEILFRIALIEAQQTAISTGRTISLDQTSLMKWWLQDEPQEARTCLNAFGKVLNSHGVEDGIQALRRAVVDYFNDVYAGSYRETYSERNGRGSNSAHRPIQAP